jgi:hypothetical protein
MKIRYSYRIAYSVVYVYLMQMTHWTYENVLYGGQNHSNITRVQQHAVAFLDYALSDGDFWL